ncbi:hypothetical protein DMN77_04730 [Paenibacillus sp. 79R4]|uniref:hypothetical protein n=1 Tax=Paenibacillus sp. 79R4 TaxID=2212847 RepID=UPI0015C14689|nr:hypothetical protein [Paenibacillus sp. 79R4]NWL86903.1 hypothetical protein [Paenibacillus sp. 79R4]
MAKKMRRTVFYLILLAAGVTLGMQMGDGGTAGTYNPQYAEANATSNGFWQNGYYYSRTGAQPVWVNGSTTNGNGGYAGNTGTGVVPDGYYVVTPQPGQPGYQTAPGAEVSKTPSELLMPPAEAPGVDQIADKTANLLQQISKKGIHWVASWFNPEG